MPGNEITAYISAIAIETIDGMLRQSLQRSETTNHATYDFNNNATNQETAVALWCDDVV